MYVFVHAGQQIFSSNVVACLCVLGFYISRHTEQCSDTFAQIILSHVMTIVSDHLQINWVSAYSTDDAGHSNMSEPFDNYIISLYWSVMTMSTIGYGDVTPKTQYERIYEIFGMILGASVYAYMVGAICSIVASMNAASAEFNQQMDR